GRSAVYRRGGRAVPRGATPAARRENPAQGGAAVPRRCPTLTNPDIRIRLARNADEVRRADRLVFRNYVERGYWRNDETELRRNEYLRLPTRHVMVVADGAQIIGTLSLIL